MTARTIPTDEAWLVSGDSARNSRDCFTEAILEIRRRKFPDTWKPETDEERKLLDLISEGRG